MKLVPVSVAVLAAASILAGCGRPEPPPAASAPVAESPAPPDAADARDVHSYAQPEIARVRHVDLELTADFQRRVLSGSATLRVVAAGDSPTLTLDTQGLQIETVTDDKGRALAWSMGETDAILGTPLRVQLGDARDVVVRYRTRPEAEALQWLKPGQTSGKREPYLYSQGQAILTRTWIPTQDSPAVRQTWTARVTAPEKLTVVMSAEMLGPQVDSTPGMRAWRFRMDEPVPPYLIAIAVGDLAFQSLGERTGVYTEPSMLKAAAHEFADLEKMLEAAEKLYGPYRWGRYDVLVMPPSFPFGGMENPRLTFATPTILAGDRSLVSLIAHELAHSWSGNLVTNATWRDFWLNEGFTSYIENRIMEAVYGEATATMLADLDWDEMQEEITALGGMAAADTRLHYDLAGRTPDDGMTEIPYDKGATFLRTIESSVGRRRWDEYLRAYFDRHAFQSLTSAEFLADLREYVIKGDTAMGNGLQLNAWVYEPGLPANAVHRRSDVLEQVDSDALAFDGGRKLAGNAAAWGTPERVRFLNRLPRKQSPDKLVQLRALLDLDNQRNSEVQFAWLRLAIANRYDPALPQLEQFLTSMGRRKFVVPLLTDLMEQEQWGTPVARRIYERARPGYHSVTTSRADEVVLGAAAN